MASRKALAAAGALALIALAGCGDDPAGTSGGKLANGGTFTLVLGADPGNLDPHFTSLSSAHQVDRFLYDSLVNIDETGRMVAGLADRWQATTTTATFTLRKGVTCADGTPLTAGQVAANINFVGDPKNASSRIGFFVPAGATASGDDAAGTVTVTSPTPDSFLDRNVGGLQIVCGRGMADRGLLRQGADGTGMFTVAEAVSGDHYTLRRRADYAWGPGDWRTGQPGLPDTVVLRIVANESTAANLLLSKAVNAVQLVGPDQQRVAATKAFVRSVEAPLGELWFNQKAGFPGADEAVRRALTQALDLGQLAQVVSSGRGRPATGLAPGGPCGRNTIGSNLPSHDVTAAKAALDAAGWTAGADGVRVRNGTRLAMAFYFPTTLGQGMQAGAELVQNLWKGVGVEVTLRGVTDAETSQLIVGGQAPWSAALLPLGLTLPTQAVPFFSGPTAPTGTNFASIDNPDYIAAVRAASAVAGSGGCAQWDAAEQALFRRADIVPFVNSNVPVFGQGTTFELSQGSVTPGSIRMLG
ncbi:ABC transporter substrate-binding protein [Micromonospora sp. NPDC049559]|uniref:ABC transporter substrate-binding protein n=1 Tax=Micromonospora sp. NPDC049559 TaxID=3155923 RepID=UPI00342A69D3